MIKYIALVKRKPGLTREEFYKHWKEKHGPLVTAIVPGLRRYVQNHPVEALRSRYEYDGIAELWFDDYQEFRQFLAWRKTNEAKPMVDDELRFLDSNMIGFVVEEYIFK